MMKAVKWFHMEEEFSIGLVLMNEGNPLFVTEEAVRFDAPFLTVCDSLTEAIGRKWFPGSLTAEDLVDEDREAYEQEVADITKEYVKAYRQIMLNRFLKIMDERFREYRDDGIMESYKYDSNTHTMWLSKEDMETDHNYMWCALDGAIGLWNVQHKPYYIVLDESAPDENGMIKYEFEICSEDDYEDLVQDGIEE